MANHKSSEKRIRQTEKRKTQNKYHARTTRNAVRDLRNEENKEQAAGMFPKVTAMLDKLAKKNIIHPNKAANLKSKLARKANAAS